MAAAEFTPRRPLPHILSLNAYYVSRNALARFCHRRSARKRIARRGIDLPTMYQCKWT